LDYGEGSTVTALNRLQMDYVRAMLCGLPQNGYVGCPLLAMRAAVIT